MAPADWVQSHSVRGGTPLWIIFKPSGRSTILCGVPCEIKASGFVFTETPWIENKYTHPDFISSGCAQFSCGGEIGIWTLEALLTLTRFPVVRFRPLSHLSTRLHDYSIWFWKLQYFFLLFGRFYKEKREEAAHIAVQTIEIRIFLAIACSSWYNTT